MTRIYHTKRTRNGITVDAFLFQHPNGTITAVDEITHPNGETEVRRTATLDALAVATWLQVVRGGSPGWSRIVEVWPN